MSLDLVQRIEVEVGSFDLLEQYLELVIKTVFVSHKELFVKIVKNDDLSFIRTNRACEKKRLPLVIVGVCHSGSCVKFCGENSIRDATDHISKIIRTRYSGWKYLFESKVGGSPDFFSCSSGAVGIGFDLRNGESIPEYLVVSMIQVLYDR